MDYEKAYKESLERASKLRVQNPFDTVSQMMEHVFPELADSEEERIRKRLIQYFSTFRLGTFAGLEPKKIIDWLKDLKDRVQPQSTWKPSDEQIGALEHFVRSITESGFASPYDSNTKLVYSLLNDIKKLKL